MKKELKQVLNRIWMEGRMSGDFMTFDEWLSMGDREQYVVEQLNKVL